MSDRELLEAAAKAVGIEYGAKRSPTGSLALYIGPIDGWWNPLTDDGDALRLAVKLEMTIHCDGDIIWVTEGVSTVISHDELPKADPMAATRRAIVRAAAAIGKDMP